jgi:EF hand
MATRRMKTSTILTTTSLIALLSSFGLIACGGSEVEPADQSQSAGLTQPAAKTPAPEAMRPEARGDHHGPRGEHGFGPPSPDKLIERFDTNKDGQLQAAELPPRMQENIGQIDTSGDGVVSKDELTARFAAKRAEFEQHAKDRFAKRDTNHDGALEQSEVGAEHWAKLSAADANGDQKLTPEELKAAFESGKLKPMTMRGEHGRRWEHGGKDEAPQAPAAPATPATPAQ